MASAQPGEVEPGEGSLEAERNRARDRLAASRSHLVAAAREVFPPKTPPEPPDPRYPRSHLFRLVRRHHKALLVGVGLLALTQPRRALALATRGTALVATARSLAGRLGLQ